MSESGEETLGNKSPAKTVLIQIVVIAVIYAITYGLTVAADSPNDPFVKGITIVDTVAIISFGLNTLVFFVAFALQTEKFYDLTGSITYISCVAYSLVAGEKLNGKVRAVPVVASCLVFVWAARLGSFLFQRILKDGKDDRFDLIKVNFFRFLIAWTLQGLWVFLTAYAVIVANASSTSISFGAVEWVGLCIWFVGFGIEVVSDRQKSYWRTLPENRGQFIEYGLWYYSRHPNYFGEWLLWTGMFVLCAPTFEGSQWAAVLSPVFVFVLLNYVSGVNLNEAKADKKWGGQSDYENYKATTSEFFLLPKLGKRIKQEGRPPATSV